MCIIAAKPVGIAMPEDNIIENMWNGNSDGAGFMYAENGSVHIRKGFMTFDSFRKALDEFCKTHDTTNTALVMHFRITTHGGTKPENCHPFPITDSVGMLSKLECKTRIGVAHNGIIPITPRKGISDTMEYIASQLSPLCRAVPDFYRNKHLIEMIYNATTSRLAFLDSKGDIFTVGTFFEDKGIKYSNESYKRNTRFFSCSYGHGGWFDDYWDDYDPAKYGNGNSTADLGYFTQKELMWLDNNFGYVYGGDQYYEDTDNMFALDRDNKVYVYSYTLDAMRRMDRVKAYSYTGKEISFDPDNPNITSELVFIEDPMPTPKKKSSKKKSKSQIKSAGPSEK